jgi:hypothetical protein
LNAPKRNAGFIDEIECNPQSLPGNPGCQRDHRTLHVRSKLMDHIYPDQRIVSDRTVDSHIKNLRKKIAATSPETELIQSVYGVGYKYDE